MSEFAIKLLGSAHYYFAELPSQLMKKVKGEKTAEVVKYNGKKVVIITMPKGSISGNDRFGGTPAMAVSTFFGGIIYAEEDLPRGVILHEVGHLVVKEAHLKNITNVVALHGKNSSIEELTADDFSKAHGGAESLKEFLVTMRENVAKTIMDQNNVSYDVARDYISAYSDYDLRISRL